jgi:outer membrane protein assembly factor BamE
MRYLNIFLFILFTSLLAACGTNVPKIKPFKMDIQQGNVVTSKMLLQLRPGMTKSQVRFIMGTPLVVDSFHPNRWDYFYQMRQAGKVVEKRRVILDFDKDVLLKVRGDVVPAGTAGAADSGADAGGEPSLVPNDGVTAPKSIETQPKKEEGLLDKLMFWKKDNKASTVAAKPAVPVAATPIELPSIEVPAAALAEEAPSMLAVPIALPSEPAIEAAPKIVEPKVEATPKADAAKLKAAKKEAAKLEAAQAKAAKLEAAKAEAAKVEEAKLEAAKMKAAKKEAAKLEAAQAKTAKLEAAKLKSAQAETAKQEAAKQQAQKAEAAQAAAAAAAAEPSPAIVAAAPAIEAAPVVAAKPVAAKACYRAECDNYKTAVSVSPAVSTKP